MDSLELLEASLMDIFPYNAAFKISPKVVYDTQWKIFMVMPHGLKGLQNTIRENYKIS